MDFTITLIFHRKILLKRMGGMSIPPCKELVNKVHHPVYRCDCEGDLGPTHALVRTSEQSSLVLQNRVSGCSRTMGDCFSRKKTRSQ